jgi:hypothetical protein
VSGGILGRLWRGDLPLPEAFWTWAVAGGLAVNLLSILALLILVTRDQPVAALVAGHAVSLPYNIVVGVGVWRSAGRYGGPPHWARAARIVTLVGLTLLSLV